MSLYSDENGEATIIPNEGGEVVSNGALPDTPVSQRNVAFYANVTAIEGSPQSQRASEPVGGALSYVALIIV